MTTQPTPPPKAEASPHRYHASANILSGHFEQPIATVIEAQSSIVLPEDGKYTYQAADRFQLVGALSYRSGYTQVAGYPNRKTNGFVTIATSVVENLNVFDVVTADRVVAQISTIQPVNEDYAPSVAFLGTRFENLRIGGSVIEVKQDLNMLTPSQGYKSFFDDGYVRDRIAHQYRAVRDVPHLPEWAEKEFLSDAYEMKDKIRASLVQAVVGAPGISFGHVIDLPDFGRIFLGELLAERKENSHLFQLSMIRIEFDALAKGTIRIVNVACNGGRSPESKIDTKPAPDIKGSFAQTLAPWFGFITERLAELDLSGAIPGQEPPDHLVDGSFLACAHDSGPTPELRRANAWSAALETQIRDAGEGRKLSGTVLTTYGFFRTLAGVRLGVIHYLEPSLAFSHARPPAPIEIMGWKFPVVIRPWIPTLHRGSLRMDGNCWVTFVDDSGEAQPGILTARHALAPKNIKGHGSVHLSVLRPRPSEGNLHRLSEKMDAALVAIDKGEWSGKVAVKHSRTIGYKQVRLITGHGSVDADITQHSGFSQATFQGERGKEPLNGAYMFINRTGERGDSGCLVLDTEYVGAIRPYLLYLGAVGTDRGVEGYGLFIEQVNKVWGLECYMNADPGSDA